MAASGGEYTRLECTSWAISESGEYVFFAKDSVNNSSEKIISVRIDATPPNIKEIKLFTETKGANSVTYYVGGSYIIRAKLNLESTFVLSAFDINANHATSLIDESANECKIPEGEGIDYIECHGVWC